MTECVQHSVVLGESGIIFPQTEQVQVCIALENAHYFTCADDIARKLLDICYSSYSMHKKASLGVIFLPWQRVHMHQIYLH